MAQIGTVRLETQNSGVVDVPVFEPGDSASGIYEFVRVETASGPGFIPVTDPVDATYPYLRVQSQNNGIVAVTDTPGSDIPDSGIARYTFDNDDINTSTDPNQAIDIWNGNNGDINGPTTGATGINPNDSGESFDFPNSSDVVSIPDVTNGLSAATFAIWVNFDSVGGFNRVLGCENNNFRMDNDGRVYINGSNVTFSSFATGSDLLIGFVYDKTGLGDGNTLKIYQNDANEIGSGSPSSSDIGAGSKGIMSQDFGTNGSDGRADDPRFYSKALTATEWSNLYNTGSISN